MLQVKKNLVLWAVGTLGAMINIAVVVSGVLMVSWFKKVYSRLKEDEMKTAYIH